MGVIEIKELVKQAQEDPKVSLSREGMSHLAGLFNRTLDVFQGAIESRNALVKQIAETPDVALAMLESEAKRHQSGMMAICEAYKVMQSMVENITAAETARREASLARESARESSDRELRRLELEHEHARAMRELDLREREVGLRSREASLDSREYDLEKRELDIRERELNAQAEAQKDKGLSSFLAKADNSSTSDEEFWAEARRRRLEAEAEDKSDGHGAPPWRDETEG